MVRQKVPWLVTAAFVLLGCFWGSWNASLASIQGHFRLSNAALGILLAVGVVAGAVAGSAATHLGRRLPPVHLLAVIVVTWAILGLPLIAMDALWPFIVVFTAVQIIMGSVDAVMNVGATAALAGQPGRLVRFHATFNLGAMLGALATGVSGVATNGGSWLWPIISALLLIVVTIWFLVSRDDVDPTVDEGLALPLPSPFGDADPMPATATPTSLWALLRHDRLIALLIVFAAAALVEGGVFTWGVLYLRRDLHIGLLAGASAYALGNGVAGLGRVLAGPAIGERSPLRTLAVGSLVTGCGLLVESHTHNAALAASMLVVTAAGVSLNWPLLMADVGHRSSAPSSAVGAFTASGYIGWVAGAPLIGAIADRWDLSTGLAAVAVIGLGVSVTAGFLAHRSTAEAGER